MMNENRAKHRPKTAECIQRQSEQNISLRLFKENRVIHTDIFSNEKSENKHPDARWTEKKLLREA